MSAVADSGSASWSSDGVAAVNASGLRARREHTNGGKTGAGVSARGTAWGHAR